MAKIDSLTKKHMLEILRNTPRTAVVGTYNNPLKRVLAALGIETNDFDTISGSRMPKFAQVFVDTVRTEGIDRLTAARALKIFAQ